MGTVELKIAGKDFQMQAPVNVMAEFTRECRRQALHAAGKAPPWVR